MPANKRSFVPGLWHGRPTEPEQSDETDEYSDDGYDTEYYEEFYELYQPDERMYRVGDKVWIRIKRTWYNGIVRQVTFPDENKDGRFIYHVHFHRKNSTTNMKTIQSPRDGTLKPDSIRIRLLLSNSGARIGSAWDAL